MNAQPVFAANRTEGRLRTRARDPLQVPIALGFAAERIVPNAWEILRSLLLWLLTFAVAASGALLVGNMPELKAAVPVVAAPAATVIKAHEASFPSAPVSEPAQVEESVPTF